MLITTVFGLYVCSYTLNSTYEGAIQLVIAFRSRISLSLSRCSLFIDLIIIFIMLWSYPQYSVVYLCALELCGGAAAELTERENHREWFVGKSELNRVENVFSSKPKMHTGLRKRANIGSASL